MARILFVHNLQSSFVRADHEILSAEHEISSYYVSGRRVNVARLIKAIRSHDLIFCWFASWHSFFPVLVARRLGRPTIVVTGGYDTANLPEIGYGHQRGGLRKIVSRAILRSATHLAALSEYSRRELLEIDGISPSNAVVLYLGLRSPEVPAPEQVRKESLVLTVAGIDRLTLRRKGLEPFVRAASLLPDVDFVTVGAWRDNTIAYLKDIAPTNVQFTGFVDDEALADIRLRAKVYVQLSLHEGLGLAVAESMLAYCVPVVSRAGALPEVVGDCGIYAKSTQPFDVAQAIQEAMRSSTEMGIQARQRIIGHFPYEQRQSALLGLVQQALDGS